jgi:hypothetical protein
MAATFPTLGAHDIGACLKSFLGMFRRADHIHNEYAGIMELLDRPWRWKSKSTDKDPCSTFDYDINQLVQLALCIVVIRFACGSPDWWQSQINTKGQ